MGDTKENTVTTSSEKETSVRNHVASIDYRDDTMRISIYCQSPDEKVEKLEKKALNMFEVVKKQSNGKRKLEGYE
jgi:hypothetical protein